jgi:hypothetical protein
MNKIINTIKNHKKLVITLLLLITVSVIGTVIVLNKPKTIEQPKVAETKQEVKDEKKTSTKEDKKSNDKKNDDKKSDEKKTDVKPEATVAPSNDATVEETQNTTSNNVSNNTSTTNNNTSNSTSNNTAPAPCVPTYTTVTHPAVGHYEQREIMPAYNKPIYAEKLVGGTTGRLYNNTTEFANQEDDFNYSVQQVQVGTEYVPAVYDNVWVEDQPAYTTTEASGC